MAIFYSTNNFGGNLITDELTETYQLERKPQKVWGYEAAINFTVSDNIDLGFSYSWLEGKKTEGDIYLDGNSINPP
ncbi:MAG: hypothetical protein V7784_23750 [Oceanospirillaceae bacterium]|jgi:iron complex outermembrane receptor protein